MSLARGPEANTAADEARGASQWHTLEVEEVFSRLDTGAQGLSAPEARARLVQHGRNVITEQQRRSVWRMLLDQFLNVLILVLIGAAVVAGIAGEPQDAVLIILIVVLNAVFGVLQEYRAERAVAALRQLAAQQANVVRDGKTTRIDAAELVPGDVVVLQAGDAVPADLRLVELADLQIDESLLTGESAPIDKSIACIRQSDAPVGDRINLTFKGTLVTRGRGTGVVVATGMRSELGRIAGLLQAAPLTETPLQRRLGKFGARLALAVLVVCALFFAAGWLRGEPVLLMFLTAVSLAVAAVPEALPAVVTISLAFGASKMGRHNALIRRLPAVETLGSVTYICADKTGTLTENRMRLERVFVAGTVHDDLAAIVPDALEMLGPALSISNDVHLEDGGKPVGDPTELALYEAAAAVGFDAQRLQAAWPRIGEVAFDAERKRMSTLHRTGDEVILFCKGAPEAVLDLCAASIGEAGFDRAEALARAELLAGEGYRVLAIAFRQLTTVPEPLTEDVEQSLTLLSLAALIDPPRKGVEAAVGECITAGIVPVMITGDHPATARSIAVKLGICRDGDVVLTGSELETLSDEALEGRIEHIRVYARASPQQKIRIVTALQRRGQFVAMTGDGVNDAPALKRADIGVAMGRKGTDVAREAADMVLLDDNFSTIVAAVREGRRIYDNIRKFIKDTMSSNSGEIWTLLLAPLVGLPIPLLPVHILWINLVTDGLPGLAFTAEPAERKIMSRPPRPPGESLFARGMWQHIIWFGLFVGAVSVGSQAWAISRGSDYWQTVVFTVLTISQLFHSLAVRSETDSLWSIGVLSNPAMIGAVLLTVALQLMIIYVPALNAIFHTQPLPLFDLSVCFGLSALSLVVVEFEKWLIRRGLIYT